MKNLAILVYFLFVYSEKYTLEKYTNSSWKISGRHEILPPFHSDISPQKIYKSISTVFAFIGA